MDTFRSESSNNRLIDVWQNLIGSVKSFGRRWGKRGPGRGVLKCGSESWVCMKFLEAVILDQLRESDPTLDPSILKPVTH